MTDEFSSRLEALHTARACPAHEIDAAVLVFERLKTALAICSTLGIEPDRQGVLEAVFSALCDEAKRGQGTMTRE